MRKININRIIVLYVMSKYAKLLRNLFDSYTKYNNMSIDKMESFYLETLQFY